MSDPPVTFKKTKAKRAQRARDLEADPTSEPAADTGEDSPSVLATKLKNKLKTRTKPQSRLSFGGPEEEGDVEEFKIKKSKLSKRVTHVSSHIPAAPYAPTISTPSSGGPTYSAAYLSELKAATPSARPVLPEDESISYDADVSMSEVDTFVASSSISSIVDLTMEEKETIIPSTSSIEAVKQKREHMRKTGVSEDFISLSITKRESQGPHPMSRLMREEDEIGEAEDEFAEYTSAQERIALGKKSRKLEAKKKREEMNELIVDAEEEDEETIEWEQAQLRRGGHAFEELEPKAQKAIYKAAAVPQPTPIPTLGPAIARLTQSLSNLTSSHAQHTTSMASLGEEQTQLETREKEMRDMIAKAEEKRSWFVAFREWVESVATFLDEKFPLLQELEDEQLSLLQERYDMVNQRRQADDEDDLSLFLGTLPTPPAQQDQTDDLGRVVPQTSPTVARKERISAREARRIYRRAKGVHSQEEEGYSTDATLPPSDAADYALAVEKLLGKANEIVSDVEAKDFLDPRLGLGKWFDDWRSKFGDIYTSAFGGLGMVGAWEFWTRLEILEWNPMETTRTLDTFTWYQSLHDYSRPGREEDDMESEAELGPDGDLVSAMISTAVIPRICKILEKGGLDPYSAKDVRRLIDLCEEIEVSVPKEHLKFELLLKSAFITFQTAVTSSQTTVTKYLQLNQPRFDPEAIPARRRFLSRRYKLMDNILRWRKYAGEMYGLGQLVTTLVADVMLPVAESGWEVGGEDSMRKVLQVRPPELVPVALRARLNIR
ncbi:unnamed protein product [Somion occarium]|uniref:GCF C-terminal domain-containing protein n=1 Tax=Somion occarium TaxID=3059160 RepID=A0ABP1DYU3_9APHY